MYIKSVIEKFQYKCIHYHVVIWKSIACDNIYRGAWLGKIALPCILDCLFDFLYRVFLIASSVFSTLYYWLPLRFSLPAVYSWLPIQFSLPCILDSPSIFSTMYSWLPLRFSIPCILDCHFGFLYLVFLIASSVFSTVYSWLPLRFSLTCILGCLFGFLYECNGLSQSTWFLPLLDYS
jgi:hypothetical protein